VERPSRFAIALRRPADWRLGWTAGVGVGVTPQGSVEGVAAILYGVQF